MRLIYKRWGQSETMQQSQVNKADWISDLNIAHALAWRYVIALLLVAILSTAAWLSLHLVIAEQKSTAVVVNVSGRQRMLSQRTALFSNLLVSTPRAERSEVRSKLTDAIQLMEHSHHILIHGDNEMGLPITMSPTVHSMYFDGPNALDEQVVTYIKIVHELLLLDDDGLTTSNPLLQYITQNSSNALVAALDQMVRQYQFEGEASVDRLQKAETIFWAVTLLLLALEAALIFHPFVKHVKIIIGKLQRVTEELQLHQNHLEETVRQRTAELESRSNALAESEEKFRLISTTAKDAIAIVGTEEQVVYWNPAAEKLFGYEANQAIGKNLHTLLTPVRYRDEAHSGFERFRQYGEGNLIGKTLELTALHKSGEEFPIELSISAFMFSNSWHALGIIRDITEHKKLEYNLRTSALYTRSLLEASLDPLVTISSDGKIMDANNATEKVTGCMRNELIGSDFSDYFSEPNKARAGYQQVFEDGFVTDYPLVLQHKSGSTVDVLYNASVYRNENGEIQGVFAAARDITEQKKLEDQIRQLAFYDPLTQLPNRRLLKDRLSQAIVASKRSGCYGAVMFLDLDNFKPLNDTYGHVVGDLLLIETAKRLKSCVREMDTVARFGGDEFVVLLSELNVDNAESIIQARIVAEKICTALSEAYCLSIKDEGAAEFTVEHHCTASIGVRVFINHEGSQDDIINAADAAMFQAKEAGRNLIRFYDLKD